MCKKNSKQLNEHWQIGILFTYCGKYNIFFSICCFVFFTFLLKFSIAYVQFFLWFSCFILHYVHFVIPELNVCFRCFFFISSTAGVFFFSYWKSQHRKQTNEWKRWRMVEIKNEYKQGKKRKYMDFSNIYFQYKHDYGHRNSNYKLFIYFVLFFLLAFFCCFNSYRIASDVKKKLYNFFVGTFMVHPNVRQSRMFSRG